MYTPAALMDIHERAHRNLTVLLQHCRALTSEDLHRELDGFGYPTVQLQAHHAIGAERYWIGVLLGRMDADDDAPDFPTVAALESLRAAVYASTQDYLAATSVEDLNAARRMTTWGNKERLLVPALVVMRTATHLYHHQGQIVAMCRLMGRPGGGLDFPLD